jgi:hypothetical protein
MGPGAKRSGGSKMRLEELIGREGMAEAREDHSNECYECEGLALAINMRGQYTAAELEYKMRLLREAQSLYLAYGN